ncbi:hypothetical protein, partial [Enterococcus rivorum]|uniref:hypothetical protein n=1 Tax=Enterococcus rivorum TaxID=762845 RepID=UPI001B8090FC
PWTPLFSTRYFPLLGRTRDFNPLEFDHAGQTKEQVCREIISPKYLFFLDTILLIFLHQH